MSIWRDDDPYHPDELASNAVADFWDARARIGVGSPAALGVAQPEHPKGETLAERLNRLREECRLTVEQLAEEIEVNKRTVARHLAGDSIPYKRHIAGYERVFSRMLNRKIVLGKMP